MKIIFEEKPQKDFNSLEPKLQGFFRVHIDKLQGIPPRRHLKHHLPWHVEDVTRQARLVYNERNDALFVIRCFATHKEYQRWYQSYR